MNFLKKCYTFFVSFFFDVRVLFVKWRAIPDYIRNIIVYNQQNRSSKDFQINFGNLHFATKDKYMSAGSLDSHYFFQDLWAARQVIESGAERHVDVGSRIDGFVAHVLTSTPVEFVDIRKIESFVDGLTFCQGSITDLPHATNSVPSLSCLHVIEHIGLGRYGDDIDPDGYKKGIAQLARILAPGGKLYFGTPVGRQRVEFDAHRVFHADTIINEFAKHGVHNEQFHLINDIGQGIHFNASVADANKCRYGCGLFVFSKKA